MNSKHLAQIHPESCVYPSANIFNYQDREEAINIGPRTHILGELLVSWKTGSIEIGQRCYVSAGTRIWSQASVIIGNYVLISHNVDIHDSDSHPLDWAERRIDAAAIYSGTFREPTLTVSAPVIIEDDVWIGFKATILKGVRIGRGAIIAAASVVTKDVPPFTLVAGNPARVIRQLPESSSSSSGFSDQEWEQKLHSFQPKFPDQSAFMDLQTQIDLKQAEIKKLTAVCQERLAIINSRTEKIPVAISLLADSKTSLSQETTPQEKLISRKQALNSLLEAVEEKELQVSFLHIFDFPKLGRKLANAVRFQLRKFNANPAPEPIVQGRETPPDSKLDLQLAAVHKSIRLSGSKYHRLESVLLAPPFFSYQTMLLKFRLLFTEPRLFFAELVYRKWAKHWKTRLGILAQKEPRPMFMETFPKSRTDQTNLPSISIVTPSYNQANYIAKTIASVVEQNYPGLEYYVQDGNSQDGTVDILIANEKRLTGWQSAPDGGQSDAIIKGFEKTTGEIMAWLNSDDLLMPGALHYIGEYFANHPEVDVVYGHRVIIDEKDQEIGRWFLPPHAAESLRWADFVPQETLFWRRRAWDAVGGLDPDFHFAMDWDFLLRLQRHNLVIDRLPYFLGCFRIHESQKTSSAIQSTGQREMDQLRLREHGRAISNRSVDLHVKPFLIKSGIYHTFWRCGIRL